MDKVDVNGRYGIRELSNNERESLGKGAKRAKGMEPSLTSKQTRNNVESI